VLSIDAGTGFLSRTGTISYNVDGKPIPAENNPRRIFDRLFRGDNPNRDSAHASLQRRIKLVDAVASSARTLDAKLGKTDRERMDQYLSTLGEMESRLVASERWIDVPLKKQDYSHLNLEATERGRSGRVLPQHVRPDRACLRCGHHSFSDIHAQSRRRHGDQ
jgi:hypothetical protein